MSRALELPPLSPRGTAVFSTEALVGPAPAGVSLVGPSLPLRPRGDPPASLRWLEIGWIATRLADAGIETFVLDLTRPRFAVPVVRVVAPGLQIEPSQLENPRLQRAVAATGGGHRHTGGVELF